MIPDDLPDDLALRDDEAVCAGCNLAYFHRLPRCPELGCGSTVRRAA